MAVFWAIGTITRKRFLGEILAEPCSQSSQHHRAKYWLDYCGMLCRNENSVLCGAVVPAAMDLERVIAQAFESLEKGTLAQRDGRLREAREKFMVCNLCNAFVVVHLCEGTRADFGACTSVLCCRTESATLWRRCSVYHHSIRRCLPRTCAVVPARMYSACG